MATLIAVVVALAAGMLFLMFGTDFGKDPSKKTLPQLRRIAELQAKRVRGLDLWDPKSEVARAEMKRVIDEIEKRETMLALAVADATSIPPGPAGPTLRSAAREAYEDGLRKAKALGKDDQKAHEMALVTVLFERIRAGAPLIQPTKSVIDVLTMEILPFKLLSSNQGAAAIIEYVVWRERPTEADEGVVATAIQDATKAMLSKPEGSALLDSLQKVPFPWAKLLPTSPK